MCTQSINHTLPLPSTLQFLSCGANRLSSLPSLETTILKTLFCDNNRLTSLPSLPSMLERLCCSNNRLAWLPSLPTTLLHLVCNHNCITSLPSLPTTLMDLCCNDNCLTSLPPLPISLCHLFSIRNCFPDQNRHESIRAFEARLGAWEQERTNSRVGCFKEELMMNRWHPSRMEAYLEQGVDLEDV